MIYSNVSRIASVDVDSLAVRTMFERCSEPALVHLHGSIRRTNRAFDALPESTAGELVAFLANVTRSAPDEPTEHFIAEPDGEVHAVRVVSTRAEDGGVRCELAVFTMMRAEPQSPASWCGRDARTLDLDALEHDESGRVRFDLSSQRICSANDVIHAWLGYPRGSLAGKWLAILFHDADAYLARDDSSRGGSRLALLRRADGSLLRAMVVANALPSVDPTRRLGMLSCTRARIDAEASHQASDAALASRQNEDFAGGPSATDPVPRRIH